MMSNNEFEDDSVPNANKTWKSSTEEDEFEFEVVDKRQKLNQTNEYNKEINSSKDENRLNEHEDVTSNLNTNTNTVSDEMDRDDVAVADDEDPPITSSFENIIPPHLMKNLGVFGMFMTQAIEQTIETVQTKAVEINNSETMKNIKSKTADIANVTYENSIKGWDKTKEMAAPLLSATAPYYEKGVNSMREGVVYVTEKASETLPSLDQARVTMTMTHHYHLHHYHHLHHQSSSCPSPTTHHQITHYV